MEEETEIAGEGIFRRITKMEFRAQIISRLLHFVRTSPRCPYGDDNGGFNTIAECFTSFVYFPIVFTRMTMVDLIRGQISLLRTHIDSGALREGQCGMFRFGSDVSRDFQIMA